MPRLPHGLSPYLFGLILTGLMTFLVAGVATLRTVGLTPDFGALWLGAWLPSWAAAFPVVLVVAPLTRRLVAALCAPPPGSAR